MRPHHLRALYFLAFELGERPYFETSDPNEILTLDPLVRQGAAGRTGRVPAKFWITPKGLEELGVPLQ